jgi:Zn-dependent peptidase ImmA (M78 family)
MSINRNRTVARINVNNSVLHWAVMRSGKPMEIEDKFPKLSKWMNGETQPTLHQLEEFAKATYTPLGYFFLQSPPEERLQVPHFRSISDKAHGQKPSPNLIETVHTMERRQSWMREYLIKQGASPLSFVNSAKLHETSRSIATKIRTALGLTETWASEQPNWGKALQELREKIEGAGIIIFSNGVVGNNNHRKLDVSEFRGFILVDEYAPLIFINGSDGKAAQMFTLAHELSHIFFGKSAIFDLYRLQPADDIVEKKCNQVAAEFLVPENHLRDFWQSLNDKSNLFQAIAQHYKVSEIVAAYRLLNVGLITSTDFDEFYRTYMESEYLKSQNNQSGGNFYATQNIRISRNFGIAVVCATREGSLLYRDAYNLTGLHGDTFERYAEKIGVC